MAGIIEKGEFSRLEDFIALANKGEDVRMEIELSKQLVKQKVHPEETIDMKDEIDMCLFIGDYTFKVGKESRKITKVYILFSMEESQAATRVDRSVANERLKMDYKRLRDANITFEEKFF